MRQPSGQELHCTQRPALRLIGPPLAPRACAPSTQSCPLRPSVSISSGVTASTSSACLVDRIEVGRPVDALAIAPLLEHLRRGAEAGAGVDHGGAADGAADRNRDGGLARRDRHAAVAVEERHRLERVARVAVPIDVRPGLEHQHVQSRLGQRGGGRGAARARADDRDVALLALAPWLEIAEAGVLRLRFALAPRRSWTRSRWRLGRAHPAPSRSSPAAWRAAAGRGRGRSASPPSSTCTRSGPRATAC